MNIIAIDTSLGKASCCIYSTQNGLLAIDSTDEHSMQAEKLFGLLDKCFLESKLNYDDIDAYSACIGPGSFTGVRVGVAAAKGLAFAKDRPFIGITSLEALKNKAKQEVIDCAVSAGRGQVYFQSFPNGNPIALNFTDIQNNIQNKLICNCFDDLNDYISEDSFYIKENIGFNAENIAKVAANISLDELNNRALPLYVRAPDAKETSIKRKVIFET